MRPAQFDPSNPATRSYFILHARPGSIRREAVVVTNDNAKPLALAVNAVDGLTGVTSGVVYANRGTSATGAATWVSPALSLVTVPAHRSVEVGFVVRLPKHAAAGDHVAGIAFEALHPTRSGGNFSVTVIVRTVVGIEIEVPGRAVPRVRILGLALAPLPGTDVPSAVVTLVDDGGLLCRPALDVAITGSSGTSTVTEKLGTILPGDRISFPFRWPGALSDGTYAVAATASDCGPAGDLCGYRDLRAERARDSGAQLLKDRRSDGAAGGRAERLGLVAVPAGRLRWDARPGRRDPPGSRATGERRQRSRHAEPGRCRGLRPGWRLGPLDRRGCGWLGAGVGGAGGWRSSAGWRDRPGSRPRKCLAAAWRCCAERANARARR